MRIVQATVSCFLALCLFLAGAIGISPLLHVWIEHGGAGQAHVHGLHSALASKHSHREYSAHEHPHFLPEKEPTVPDYRRLLVQHSRPFELPTLQGLRRLVASMLGAHQHSPRKQEGGGHEHHSLAQLMASGLVEQALPFYVPESHRTICGQEPVKTYVICPEFRFDAQTAGRAPPRRQS